MSDMGLYSSFWQFASGLLSLAAETEQRGASLWNQTLGHLCMLALLLQQ